MNQISQDNKAGRWIYGNPFRAIAWYLILFLAIDGLFVLIGWEDLSYKTFIKAACPAIIFGFISYIWARPQRMHKGNSTKVYDPPANEIIE